MSSQRAGAVSFFSTLLSHTSIGSGTRKMLDRFWRHDSKATVSALKESLYCYQHKLNGNMPRQKTETNLCKVWPKKKDKRNQLFTWATFIANPNPPCSSLLNLRIVSKTYVRTDSARLCWRKHAAFQSHPVCYFKGKFWEFNMTKGVAPDTEESFLNESDEGTPFMGVQYCKRLHRFVSYFWRAVPVWQVVPGTLFMGYFLLRSIEFTFWETRLGGKCLFFLKEI